MSLKKRFRISALTIQKYRNCLIFQHFLSYLSSRCYMKLRPTMHKRLEIAFYFMNFPQYWNFLNILTKIDLIHGHAWVWNRAKNHLKIRLYIGQKNGPELNLTKITVYFYMKQNWSWDSPCILLWGCHSLQMTLPNQKMGLWKKCLIYVQDSNILLQREALTLVWIALWHNKVH